MPNAQIVRVARLIGSTEEGNECGFEYIFIGKLTLTSAFDLSRILDLPLMTTLAFVN